jgi:Predicted metal-dependent hydrolase
MTGTDKSEWIDLTHEIKSNMQVYPGDPEVELSIVLTHKEDYCQVMRLQCSSHAGTHMDAPCHFFAGGKKLGQFSVDRFMGRGIIIDAQGLKANTALEKEFFTPYERYLDNGSFVVIRTGWDRYFNQEEYLCHPYIGKSGAEYLVEKQVPLVGIDALSVDSTVDATEHAHRILLEENILLVENLTNLRALQMDKPYFFSFLPLKLSDADGAPLRAVARVCR